MNSSDLFIDFPYVFRRLRALRESLVEVEAEKKEVNEMVKQIRDNMKWFELSEADFKIQIPPCALDKSVLQQIEDYKTFIKEMEVTEENLKKEVQNLQQVAKNDSYVRSEVMVRDCKANSTDLFSKSYSLIQPFIDTVVASKNVFASRIEQLRHVVDVLNRIINSSPVLKERQRVFSIIHHSFDVLERVAFKSAALINVYNQHLSKVTQYEKLRKKIEDRQAARSRLDATYQKDMKNSNEICCPHCHALVPKEETNCLLCGKHL